MESSSTGMALFRPLRMLGCPSPSYLWKEDIHTIILSL
jgi:hypothetical protein